MRLHRADGNDELRITILGGEENPVFLPGQEIRGFVERRKPIDANYTLLYIRLFGRAKVKLIELNPLMTCKAPRSQIMLLDGSDAALELNSGPVELNGKKAREGRRWEWALRIPERCNPSASFSTLKGKDLFIQAGGEDDVPLPASFLHQAPSPCMSMNGFVEYYLEALMLNGQGGLHTTIQPVTIGHVPTTLSAKEIHTRNRFNLDGRANSYRLFEGTQNVRLSIWQTIEQAFDIDVVPQFAYRMFFDIPSAVQPGNISPLSLTIWPFHNPDECSDLMQHSYQMFYVEKFQVMIRETVRMVADGVDKAHRAKASRMVDVWDYERPANSPEDGPRSIKFLCPGPPLYLGKRMNILIPSSVDLHPSFETYNIKVSHELYWKLTMSVVGVKKTYSSSSAIVVKRPPELATIAREGDQVVSSENKFVQCFDAMALEEDEAEGKGEEEEEEEGDCGCC